MSGREVGDIEAYLLDLTAKLESAFVRDAATPLIRGLVEGYRRLVWKRFSIDSKTTMYSSISAASRTTTG